MKEERKFNRLYNSLDVIWTEYNMKVWTSYGSWPQERYLVAPQSMCSKYLKSLKFNKQRISSHLKKGQGFSL